jgi:ankyrin repeat protein
VQSVPLGSEQRIAPLSAAAEALFAAVRKEDTADLGALLSTSSTTSTTSTKLSWIDVRHPQHGGTALHVAAQLGHLGAAEALVAAGATVNARSRNGATPLHWAAGGGHVSMVRWLLDAGADASLTTLTWGACIFGRGSGQTATHWAAESGHTDVLAELAARTPLSLLVQPDEREQSPLALARREIRHSASTFLEREEREYYIAVELGGEVRSMEAWVASSGDDEVGTKHEEK